MRTYVIKLTGSAAVVPVTIHQNFYTEVQADIYARSTLLYYHPVYYRAELYELKGDDAKFISAFRADVVATKVQES
jgi:hypothetical protein